MSPRCSWPGRRAPNVTPMIDDTTRKDLPHHIAANYCALIGVLNLIQREHPEDMARPEVVVGIVAARAFDDYCEKAEQ